MNERFYILYFMGECAVKAGYALQNGKCYRVIRSADGAYCGQVEVVRDDEHAQLVSVSYIPESRKDYVVSFLSENGFSGMIAYPESFSDENCLMDMKEEESFNLTGVKMGKGKRLYKVLVGVGDRNAYAALLKDGETCFDCWFSDGVVRHYDVDGAFVGTEEQRCPADAVDSSEYLKENMWIPSNVDSLENANGDVALIYYFDDDMAADDCYGWQIFRDGVPLGMHDCHNGDMAYSILSRKGFRY